MVGPCITDSLVENIPKLSVERRCLAAFCLGGRPYSTRQMWEQSAERETFLVKAVESALDLLDGLERSGRRVSSVKFLEVPICRTGVEHDRR